MDDPKGLNPEFYAPTTPAQERLSHKFLTHRDRWPELVPGEQCDLGAGACHHEDGVGFCGLPASDAIHRCEKCGSTSGPHNCEPHWPYAEPAQTAEAVGRKIVVPHEVPILAETRARAETGGEEPMTKQETGSGATPGPWKISLGTIGGPTILAANGHTICGVRTQGVRMDFGSKAGEWDLESCGPESAANARLIAASPTMYAYIVRKASEGDTDAARIIATI